MDTQSAVTLAVGVVSVALGTWALRHRDRTDLGLAVRDGSVADVGRGLLLGLVAALVLWAAFAVTGLADVGSFAALGPTIGLGVFFAVLFLVEDVVFRGFGTGGLALLIGVWPATIVISALVATAYAFNEAAGVLAVLGQVLSNIVIGAARVRTGRVWFGWGMRITWNTGMVGLGFTDSDFHLDHPLFRLVLHGKHVLTGGAFGPEAGLVGIVVLALTLLAILRLVPATHGPWRVTRPTT